VYYLITFHPLLRGIPNTKELNVENDEFELLQTLMAENDTHEDKHILYSSPRVVCDVISTWLCEEQKN
jgi:hypothetical protein